jgi:hypothetical protein
MLSSRTRLILPVLLTTAGLAVTGCGGGGGGDEDAYVKTYEAACKEITAQNTGFEKKLASEVASAGNDQAKVLSIIKEGTAEALTTLDDQVKKLADADAPSKYSDFQDSIEEAADPLSKTIGEAKTKIAAAKTTQDFQALSTIFNEVKLPDTKVPEDLAKKIPSCKFGTAS